MTMTNRSHLTPTVVVDKNGKTTTVHRKVTAQETQKASIPAPAGTASVKKDAPFNPTAAQLRPERHDDYEREWEVDSSLLALTGSTGSDSGVKIFSFNANDVDFYSVRGAVGRIPASMLLKHGIRSGEDAKTFLKENDLEYLIQDRSALMKKALRKRIPGIMFSEFSTMTEINGLNDDDVIDALGIYAIAGYREARVSTMPPTSVARGEISASDLKTLGVKHIGKSRGVKPMIDALMRIKSGTASYDAAGLRRLLDFLDTDDREKFDDTEKAIQLADLLGVDAVISLRSKNFTHRAANRINGRVASQELAAFLIYADKGDLTILGRGIKGDRIDGAIALYRAGVDPVSARERINEGVDVETIIGAHLNLHASVVDGWL